MATPKTQDQISPDGIVVDPKGQQLTQEMKDVAAAQAKDVQDKTADDGKVDDVVTDIKTDVDPAKTDVDKTDDAGVDTVDILKEFLNVKDGINIKKEPAADKKDDKKDDKIDTTPTGVKKVVARDYADLPEDVRPLFEKMSNDAFEKLKPLYLEHGKLKKDNEAAVAKTKEQEALIGQLKQGLQPIPENYYEHENAFVLTPEFLQATQVMEQANEVLNHWEQQLAKIRKEGETWQSLHMNPQTGEFYLGAPQKVDANTEQQIINYVVGAQRQLADKRADIKVLAESHKSKHNEAKQWVSKFNQESFKPFYDPAQPHMQALVKDTVSKFPAAFRTNPLAEGMAMAMITILQLGAMLENAKKSGGNGTTTVKDKSVTTTTTTRKQPSSAELGGEGGSAGVSDDGEVSIADFKRVKEGY